MIHKNEELIEIIREKNFKYSEIKNGEEQKIIGLNKD